MEPPEIINMRPLALPKIQKGAAASLQSPNLSLPLAEANTRVAALNAFSIPAQEASARYIEREDTREMQKAVLSAHESDSTFIAANKGQEEFSIMGTDDPNFMALADELGFEDLNSAVPKHRVYAEWRARNYRDAVEEAAKGITSRTTREAFISYHQKEGATNYAKDAVEATKDQILYSAKKTMATVDQAMLNGDFKRARLAVETSGMSEERTAEANRLIDTREQVDYFNEVIEKRDISVMEGALKELRDNESKTTSMLDAQSQKVLANQLRTAINTEKTAIRAGMNTNVQIQVADARTQISDIWKGNPVNMSEYASNYMAVKDKYPVLAREMEWAQKHQPSVNQIVLSPPTAQVQALESLKKATSGGREASYLINKLETAITEGQIARRSDSPKWAKTVGFVAYGPIDYSSVESAQQSLAARIKPILSIQRKFGTFTGFLEKDELIEFGSRLENAPNKIEYFTAINNALGEYAEPFYEQLKEYNVGGTASLAGQIMSWGEGYRPVAENILRGAKLRETDKMTQLIMKEQKPELESFMVERFGGIFTGNKKQQSLNMEAFMDLYAITKDKEEAFEQLTGGTIDFAGYTLQAPVPGMSGWDYRKHLGDILPEYWALPDQRAYGFSPKQLRRGVLDGDLKQVGVGRGVSYLETEAGFRVKRMDGVSDYLFTFDLDAPTGTKAATQILKEWEKARLKEKAQRAGGVQDPYEGDDEGAGDFNKQIIEQMKNDMGGDL